MGEIISLAARKEQKERLEKLKHSREFLRLMKKMDLLSQGETEQTRKELGKIYEEAEWTYDPDNPTIPK